VHPAWLRLTHWINALALLILVTSGWRIYNDATKKARARRKAVPRWPTLTRGLSR
jgi:thiosulfate reductase cytochrome b subunit